MKKNREWGEVQPGDQCLNDQKYFISKNIRQINADAHIVLLWGVKVIGQADIGIRVINISQAIKDTIRFDKMLIKYVFNSIYNPAN